MTTLYFPTLTEKPDSSKFSRSAEDPSMKVEMEGGYTYTRARFTRKPRKKFQVAYTFLKDADRLLIENFWDTVKGGSESFYFTDPSDATVYAVRFTKDISYKYKGKGDFKAWDVSFEIEEL